ncbi:MAG: sugar ABC transporter permease [Holosporales bacterium]|jgi:trehalose/maltose transport system permease protein|nr:sugar ABC transporter permease [Holosporales bacterium]
MKKFSSANRSITHQRCRTAWLFMTPCLFVLLSVAAWPLFRTFLFSLTDAQLGDIPHAQFVGFANFAELFADDNWWSAVKNTLLFATFSVPCEAILGLMIALVLHKTFMGRGLLRAAVLVPWAIPTIVSARMWSWMLHDVYGVINELLVWIGAIAAPLPWTAAPELSLITIVLVDVWKTTPFMALLLLAGLQALPQDCFEAALVDGVSRKRIFFRITLPLLRPTLIVALIFRTLDALRIFDLVYILSSGDADTDTMSVYARRHFVDYANVGHGSAAAVCLFFIVALVTVLYINIGRHNILGEV